MNINPHDFSTKAIGLAIAKNRDKIIALLKKYGVNVDKSFADDKLIVAVLVANKQNKRFQADLKELLKETVKSHKSFTGEYPFFGFNFPGEDPDAETPATTTTTTKPKTAAGSFLANNLDSLLNTGLSTLSSVITNKANQKLLNQSLAIETEKTKQAALLAAGGGSGAGTTKTGLSTGAKIAIGVGVAAVIGVIIYVVVKK